MGGILVPTGLLSLPLLNIVYGVPNSDQLNIVAIGQVIAFVMKMISAPMLGYAVDKYGRKPFIIVGTLLLCAGIAITPNLPTVYPYYFFVLVMTDLGMSFMVSAPLLADYVDYETKGRVSGIATVISYSSSALSTYFTQQVNLQENIPSRYHVIAIVGLVLGVIIILGLKGGPYHKALYHDKKAETAKIKAAIAIEQEKLLDQEQNDIPPQLLINDDSLLNGDFEDAALAVRRTTVEFSNEEPQENDDDLKPGFMAGVREARNPWILTGYIVGFLNLAFFMLTSSVFINFVTNLGQDEDAADQAYSLTDKQLIVAVICAIFYGFFTDKYNKFKIIMFATVCSAISIILLILAPSPYAPLAYVSMVFYGVASSGFLTFVFQVISKYPNPKYRASVFAVSSMCATSGSALINVIGALLSKHNKYIPYYLYLGAVSVGIVVLMVVYSRKKHILNKL